MWIKPSTKIIINSERANLVGAIRLDNLFPNRIKNNEINIDFLSLYESDVFTNVYELLSLNQRIDVVIFTGYAGCGHYAPARALALEYERRGLNVILLDPLFMSSRVAAIINCESWKFLARHFHSAWDLTRKIVSTELGSDLAFNGFKSLISKELLHFFNEKRPDIIISTYTYTDAIISKFAMFTKCLAVLVPDLNPIGFMSEVYHDTKNIHYFISSMEAYKLGNQVYPYTKVNAGVHIMGNTPNFLTSSITPKLLFNKELLLFIPGSGLGIGKGFEALNDILNVWNGYVICICGDNPNWQEKSNNIAKRNKKLISLGYVNYDILKLLFQYSQVVIGKSGGSMSVEMAALNGCKIVYAPIRGQEVENAKYYSNLGCLSYAKTKEELIKYIKLRPYTKSIYDLNINDVSFNSTKFVCDETFKIVSST